MIRVLSHPERNEESSNLKQERSLFEGALF